MGSGGAHWTERLKLIANTATNSASPIPTSEKESAGPNDIAGHVQTKQESRQPLDIQENDECCGKALAKALQSGALASTDTWVHAKCGCIWKARMMEDGSRYWYPVVEMWVI